MGYEYRVIWRREATGRVVVFVAGLGAVAARRLALILRGAMAEALDLDPDDFACCSGRDCGCGGLTNQQVWDKKAENIPPLVEGPTIQRRTVGEWADAPVTEGE